ncbi:tail assembly chaperone [Staphylococcus phage CF5]|uniref:Tail assembly chaperone n=1 Tax=Staphylococcus phage CF5 TaxID=3113739 RepID=A0AAX4J7M5_9CAUD|nr:tail assembly chaperone [Staphylococcus phage CF5]
MAEETKQEEIKDVNEMTPEEIDKLKYQDRKEKEKVVNKVIKGVNDVWEKEYNFEELDLRFKVKVKLPNAREQGNIMALRSSYLNGMDAYQSDMIINAYQMLATLQEVGVEVPKEFQDPEDIYNLYPLSVMYNDWLDFMSSFRY